jgi:hypothetical protein
MKEESTSIEITNKVSYVTIIALVLILGPVLIALMAYGGSSLLNCTISMSGSHPCFFMGLNIEDTLGSFAMLGFFGVITVPIGLVIFIYKMVKR